MDTLADTLSSIYQDVLRMAAPVADGCSTVTTDGHPVRQVSGRLGGVMLIKGEEAEPFAMVGAAAAPALAPLPLSPRVIDDELEQ